MSSERVDVVVIGGGIVGLSIAYNLAKRQMGRIVLFEKGYLGGGGTGRSGGGVRVQFSTPEMIRFMKDSLKVYERLSQELNFNIIFDQCGYLMLAMNEKDTDFLSRANRLQRSMGVDSRLLDVGEVKKMVPEIDERRVLGAAFHRLDGTIHHDAATWGYAAAARRLGVEIRTFNEVLKVNVQQGRIRSVETRSGEVEATVVVNAAGVHSAGLASTADVHLPITPVKTEAAVTESVKHFLNPVIINIESGVFCKQTVRGEVHLGTGMPERIAYDLDSTKPFIEKLARDVSRLIPCLSNLSILRQWAGLYDMTPDASPILGVVEECEGFLQANGFSGHGLMMAPIVGRDIAELVATGRTSSLIAPFSLSRFKEGRMVREEAA